MINTWQEAIYAFNEFVDEVCPPTEIFDISIPPSVALRNCDPIAYRTYLNDWLGSEGINTDELSGDSDLIP